MFWNVRIEHKYAKISLCKVCPYALDLYKRDMERNMRDRLAGFIEAGKKEKPEWDRLRDCGMAPAVELKVYRPDHDVFPRVTKFILCL